MAITLLFWFVCVDCLVFLLFFFFFQAEDGIRDVAVTGVQTCALPIWNMARSCWSLVRRGAIFLREMHCNISPVSPRSEERRVGKSVDLGGGRITKKKKKKQKIAIEQVQKQLKKQNKHK